MIEIVTIDNLLICDIFLTILTYDFFFSFSLQIDLSEDIPNQEDEDMDDVTIIEPVSKRIFV